MFQGQKLAQKCLFRLAEDLHIDRRLPTTKRRAERDQQNLQKVMATRIAMARIFKALKT